MKRCYSTLDLKTPPQITPSGSYVMVVDGSGNPRVLQNPPKRALLHCNGPEIYWATGSDALEITLDDLKFQNQSAIVSGMMCVDSNGKFQALVNESAGELMLISKGGKVYFGAGITGATLPQTGVGFLLKDGSGDIVWDSVPGIKFYPASGYNTNIALGNPGDVLRMVGGEPKFASPNVGAVLGGTDTNDIAAVRAKSISNTEIKVDIPAINTTDGGSSVTDIISQVAVNLTFDIEDTVNGGLDTGTEGFGAWYYLYLIAGNVAPARLIASLDPLMPQLPTDYSHWALVSVFFNGGDGHIVPYIQNGRKFFTKFRQAEDFLTVTTSMAPWTVPNFQNFVPPTAKSVSGVFGSTASTALPPVIIAGSIDGIGAQFLNGGDISAGSLFGIGHNKSSFIDVPIFDSSDPKLYWQATYHTNLAQVGITGFSV